METSGLYGAAVHYRPSKWAEKVLLLALLLNSNRESPVVVAAGASKSNLFFSSAYGVCAESKFALRPVDSPRM